MEEWGFELNNISGLWMLKKASKQNLSSSLQTVMQPYTYDDFIPVRLILDF